MDIKKGRELKHSTKNIEGEPLPTAELAASFSEEFSKFSAVIRTWLRSTAFSSKLNTTAVSYTPEFNFYAEFKWGSALPVSYTHLDVYKRQAILLLIIYYNKNEP